MTYDIPTISAAVEAYAMERLADAGVSPHDSDRLPQFLDDAVNKIALQMSLEGMEYDVALANVSKASMEIGNDSPEAIELATRAYANRNSPVPQVAYIAPQTTVPADAATAPTMAVVHVDGHAAQDRDVGPVDASFAGSMDTSTELMQHAPDGLPMIVAAPQTSAVPAAPSPFPSPALMTFPMSAPAEPELACEVNMRPVKEVMPFIEQTSHSHLFNFEIPVATWEGGQIHPRIPKKIRYQYDMTYLHAVLYALATNTVTNLVGPTACGKTELIKQIGVATNMPVTLIPMDAQISRNQLIGQRGIQPTPNGPQDIWRDGIIARALKHPGIILFDEVDRGASDIHYAIHSVYTGDGLTLLDDGGRVQPMHKYNRVFTTSNTKGRGSMDGLYQTSEEMTEATRRRLTQWVEMDYQTPEMDQIVLHDRFPDMEPFAVTAITKIAHQIRESFKGATLSQSCSLTDQIETARRYMFISRMAKSEVERKVILADCIRMVMSNRANIEDRTSIETKATTEIGVDIVNHGTPFKEPTASSIAAHP